MTRTHYDVVLGAKRQVTIPAELYRELSLKEGDHLRLLVDGHTVLMEPMVSIPKRLVSQKLLDEMQARRGRHEGDLTVTEFLSRRRQQEEADAVAAGQREPKSVEFATGRRQEEPEVWQQPQQMEE